MPPMIRRTGLALLFLAFAAIGCEQKPPEWKELEMSLAEPVPEGLAFTWDHVKQADAYQLKFVHMTGAPICSLTVSQMDHPRYLLRADSLPEGLGHGWQMTLEVQAMRKGRPWPVSGVRPLKVP